MKEVTLSPPFVFSGSVPRDYDQYVVTMFFEPYAIEVVHRIDLSTVNIALELASGTGRVGPIRNREIIIYI